MQQIQTARHKNLPRQSTIQPRAIAVVEPALFLLSDLSERLQTFIGQCFVLERIRSEVRELRREQKELQEQLGHLRQSHTDLQEELSLLRRNEPCPQSQIVDTVNASSRRSAKRQHWILTQLGERGRICRRDVQQNFGISEKTAKRDLGALVKAKQIEFVRRAKPGYYRLCGLS